MTPSPGRRRAGGASRARLLPVVPALLAVAATWPLMPIQAAAAARVTITGPAAAAPLAVTSPAAPAAPVASPGAPEPAQATGGLRLVSQTALVDPDGTFQARIDLGALAQTGALSVDVSIYSVLDDDAGLLKAPTPAVRLNQLKTRKLSTMPVDPGGVLTVDVPIRSGDPVLADRIKLPDPGVYPVVVSLSNATGVVASIRLNLIRLPQGAAAATPRAVAAVVAVGGPGGLNLPEAADLLRHHPKAPVTILLGRGMLSRLEADDASARAFVAAAGTRPVLATLDPDLDPSALAAINQGDLYRDAARSATAHLQALGLTPLPQAAVVTSPLTADGAALVGSIASLAVPLPGSAADPANVTAATAATAGNGNPIGSTSATGGATTGVGSAPGRGGSSWIRTLGTPGGPLTVARLDPGPAPQVTDETRGSLPAAHRQLARVMLRNPKAAPLLLGGFSTGTGTGSGAGPGNPAAWSDPGFLDLLLGLFDQSPAAGPLRPLTLTDATLNPTGTVEPAAQPVQDLSPVVDGLAKAESLLQTYSGFYAEGAQSPAEFRARLSQALSLSRPDPGRSVAIDQINTELNQSFGQVSLPDGQSVTLAARRADIPLTVQNDAPGARYVRLRLVSDNKLQVTDANRMIRIEPGPNAVDVTVQARSLGESPLTVTVLTPDGLPLDTTRYRVRSTSFPGLGVLITAGALAALGVWWYLGFKRRGSAGHRHGHGAGAPDPDDDGPGHLVLPARADSPAVMATPAFGPGPTDHGLAHDRPRGDRPPVLAADSVDP